MQLRQNTNFNIHKSGIPQGNPFDQNPSKIIAIGTKVAVYLDGKYLQGFVKNVENRQVTVRLERKWMRKTEITVNWMIVAPLSEKFLSDLKDKESLLEKKKMNKVQELQEFIGTLGVPDMENSRNVSQRSLPMFEKYQYMHKKLVGKIELIENMRKDILDAHEELLKFRSECIDNGILENSLLFLPVLSEDIVNSSRIQAKKYSIDQKNKLFYVREKTRYLLICLLVKSGQNGIESEHIVSAICGSSAQNDANSSMKITPHRVMGMLSALSRKNEAKLLDNNCWVATKKLLDIVV